MRLARPQQALNPPEPQPVGDLIKLPENAGIEPRLVTSMWPLVGTR